MGIIIVFLSVMMRLNITWRDRRLDYLNLRDDIYQNIVPEDEFDQIWIPEIGKIENSLKTRYINTFSVKDLTMPKLENWIKMNSLLLWSEEILIMNHLIHPSIEKIMFMKDTRTV